MKAIYVHDGRVSLQCHVCGGRGSSTSHITVTGFTTADVGGGVLGAAAGYAHRTYDPDTLSFDACPSCVTKLVRVCDVCGAAKPMDRDHCCECARAFAVADRQERALATNIKTEAEKFRAAWDAKQASLEKPTVGSVKMIDGVLHVADAKGEWTRVVTAPWAGVTVGLATSVAGYSATPEIGEKAGDPHHVAVALIKDLIRLGANSTAITHYDALPRVVQKTYFRVNKNGDLVDRAAEAENPMASTPIFKPSTQNNTHAATIELIGQYIAKGEWSSARAHCATLPNDVLAAHFRIDGEGKVHTRPALAFPASGSVQAVGHAYLAAAPSGQMLVSDGTGYSAVRNPMTETEARAVLDHARDVLAQMNAVPAATVGVADQLLAAKRLFETNGMAVNTAPAATVSPAQETQTMTEPTKTIDKAPDLKAEMENAAWRAGVEIATEEGRALLVSLLTDGMSDEEAATARPLFAKAFEGRFGVPIVAGAIGGVMYAVEASGMEVPLISASLARRIGEEMRTLTATSVMKVAYRSGRDLVAKHGAAFLAAVGNLGKIAERTGIRVEASSEAVEAPATPQANGAKAAWPDPPKGAVEAQRRVSGASS